MNILNEKSNWNAQIELLKFKYDTNITYLKNLLKQSENRIKEFNEIITLKQEEYNK